MVVDHSEKTFEEAIEENLLSDGYEKGYSDDFDKEWAIDTKTLFKFIRDSQVYQWNKLKKVHGSKVEEKFLYRLDRVIKQRGIIDVLRRGVTDYGIHFNLVYFAPASGLNPKIMELYNKNILKVTRQVYYSMKNNNSLDMVLSVNGFPLVTIELKNHLTNQNVENAKIQYKKDRDPKELIFQFNKRSLVHFAVDPDQAFMTTRLAGTKTFFLPYNQGFENGAGNPPNPNGYKTEYLWRKILQKDSLLDIFGRFMHLKKEEKIQDGQRQVNDTMIFPRYHQLDAVNRMVFDVNEHGVGKNYLVQHSTGSGKSITIAWIAHQLSSLHNRYDDLIFDSIIVITDRKILDQQLQDTIYQFEHKHGVVQKIDKDSSQLAKALETGAKIIITTLHKFPHILKKVGSLPERNYAVIIDEGHRSQSGELASSLKDVLANTAQEEATDNYTYEDEIVKTLDKQGRQPNLSFFAFTATPKAKTLERFGVLDEEGKPQPFHLYSMRQAIEEGFILDVLKNYTTYKTYYKVAKKIEEDPEVDKKKGSRAIARFVSLHPHNVAQKAEIMVEHFYRVTKSKIAGKAKAMVVTSSRLHAVRYKKAFDKYIRENGYHDMDTLVAFSGSVKEEDIDKEYTEAGMNGFSQDELREQFNTDDYHVLIVANKYQTGFDQPLLHTMFVDKKLSGIAAVQTLSRLNRTHKGKHDTFVLDFVNEAEEIQKSYKPYYEQTIVEETSDPNLLYDLKYKLDDYNVYWKSELDKFNSIFYDPSNKDKADAQGMLNAFLDPAVLRYKERSEEEQDDFKSTLTTFVRQYAFLLQIIPFKDVELHKLYSYARFLLKKLPKDINSGNISLDNDVTLEYYRIEETFSGDNRISETENISGVTHAGSGSRPEEEIESLSEIIKIFNDHFGADNFSEGDKLFVDQIQNDMMNDETLLTQAKNNSKDNFKIAFDKTFIKKAMGRMSKNEKVFTKMMNDEDFQSAIKVYLLEQVYEGLQARA